MLLGLPAACGNQGDKGCVPGQSTQCNGPQGCTGYQVCNPDGNAYGACVCGDADAGSSATTFPHAGPFSGLLGAACASANDCRRGLDCVTTDSKLIHGEGPSAGMCLSRCLTDHNFCNEVDATAKCIVLDDAGTTSTADDVSYCMPGCNIGDQPAAADKCRGRVDLVCTESPAGAGSGYCRPACRSDTDCAPRACDLGTGLCGDSAPSGDAIGASCDQAGSRCAGGCITQDKGYTECSGVCGFDTPSCGQKTEPYIYYCAIGAAAKAAGGDLGYCAKLCDCDGDCARTDAVCESQSGLFARTGHHGFCASKTTSSGAARTGLPCN